MEYRWKLLNWNLPGWYKKSVAQYQDNYRMFSKFGKNFERFAFTLKIEVKFILKDRKLTCL